jgi:hypothetical protein
MDPARNANLTSQDDGKVLFDAPQDDVGMHATWITTCMTTCIGKHNEPSVLGSTELAQMRQDDSDNTVTISMDSTPSQRQPSRGRAQSECAADQTLAEAQARRRGDKTGLRGAGLRAALA